MKTISTIFKILLFTATTSAFIWSCSGNAGNDDTTGVKLHISVNEPEYCTKTSFTLGEDDTMEKLLVLFYNEQENLTTWEYYEGMVYDGETVEVEGLVPGCRYYIYALSGLDLPDNIFNYFGTIDKVEGYSWDRTTIKSFDNIPFSYVPDDPVLIETGKEYVIQMKRILAKINFMVDCSRLEGDYTIKRMNILQSPTLTKPLCHGNAASIPDDLENGDAATSNDIITLNNGGRVAFYLMENLQGNAVPDNVDPWSKTPQNMTDGRGELATYVEICGDYSNNGLYVRDLQYRFFLGEDIVSNCDIRRNTVQTVTLMLSDNNAIVKENWKITRGEVNDRRSICAGADTIHIFPYPGREDTVSLTLSPEDLKWTVSVLGASPGTLPFSIENRSDRLIVKSQQYLPEGSRTTVYPVCVSTPDKMHSDTVAIAYHPLVSIGIVLPFEPYSNFEGKVLDTGTGAPVSLRGSSAADRSDAGACLNFIFDYGGILKNTINNGVAGKDTVYERGLKLTSSDESIVSLSLSATNPTLWYFQAHSPGNAGLSARVSMGGTSTEGSGEIPVHVLSLSLNATSLIGVGASCSPSVSLANENGKTFSPVAEALNYSSQNRNVLSDAGLGRAEGKSLLTAAYTGSSAASKLSDSKEITVSNSGDAAEFWQLIIAPSSSQSLYVGESCRDSSLLIHYVRGVEASREAVSCNWSISDDSIVRISNPSGTSTLLTGLKASSNPVTLNATYYAENGISYSAKASINVTAPVFHADRQSLVWLANEKESAYARAINVTASPMLDWTAALSGKDKNYFVLSRTSGTGSGSIAVYPAMENDNYNNDRTATLTLSAIGAQSQTVSLRHRRDSLMKLSIVPHSATLDLNAEMNRADTLLRLTTDWLSGRKGVSIPNGYAEWSSDSPEVVRSAGFGRVQAFGQGTAGITASWRGISDTARINVINTERYDTTYTVRIRPDADQSIAYNGSVQFSASAQMLVNGKNVGEPFDITSSSAWISTVPAAANVHNGLATGCNTGPAPLQTMICTSYKGFDSNYVLLTVGGRDAAISSIRLEIRSFLLDEEGRTTLWKDGYISAAVYQPGDNTYNNGEQSQWCTIHGGTHYDTEVTLEVALYSTSDNDGQEHLLGIKSFTFSAMRGDSIDFDQNDWTGILKTDNFTFKATIVVD